MSALTASLCLSLLLSSLRGKGTMLPLVNFWLFWGTHYVNTRVELENCWPWWAYGSSLSAKRVWGGKILKGYEEGGTFNICFLAVCCSQITADKLISSPSSSNSSTNTHWCCLCATQGKGVKQQLVQHLRAWGLNAVCFSSSVHSNMICH